MSLTESRRALNVALLEEGRQWASLRPLVARWWADLKTWEARDTFGVAFTNRRMTARQVNVGTTARGGTFEVRNVKHPEHSREVYLARDVACITARCDPNNFFDPHTLRRRKNELGLHDLSASLLDPRRPISEQLKGYEDAVTLFVPLPLEEDLQLFYVLNKLGKTELRDKDDNEILVMRSQLTRVKLAQASDMGTRYVDVSDPGASEGQFHYGITGTIIREKGQRFGLPATPEELKARRTNALHYKSIIDAMLTLVNEVVMAYRSHASRHFPMFAQWDDARQHFRVVDVESGGYTGWIITNRGDHLYRRG